MHTFGAISLFVLIWIGVAVLWSIRLAYRARGAAADDPIRLVLTIAGWVLILCVYLQGLFKGLEGFCQVYLFILDFRENPVCISKVVLRGGIIIWILLYSSDLSGRFKGPDGFEEVFFLILAKGHLIMTDPFAILNMGIEFPIFFR